MNPRRLRFRGSVTTSLTTIFTAWRPMLVKGFQIANTNASARSVTIVELDSSGTGTVFLTTTPVPGLDLLDYGPEGEHYLEIGDSVQVQGSASGLRYFFTTELV